MLFHSLLAAATVTLVSAAESVTVCYPGNCLSGQSNVTRIGAVLDAQSTTYILLPGQYTAPVQPDSLQQALNSATATISLVNGFSNSTTPVTPNLPLNVALQPGVLSYPSDLFTGSPQFVPLPVSNSSSFSAQNVNRGSLLISSNTWIAIEATNGGSKSRTVIWDTVPYISQLPPSMAGSLQLVNVQSSSCTPACAGSAICAVDGTCKCPPGFTGASCETCADGFFGPTCKPCPADCQNCDQGIGGSGVCLTQAIPANAPSKCNCANGVCDGTTCTCTAGWTTSSTGRLCASCSRGFFLDSTGNCAACGKGCQQCSDNTGVCTQCANGLSPNANDRSQCLYDSGGKCEEGSFLAGTVCQPCNSACNTCTGAGANNCAECAVGTFFLSGQCVSTQTSPLGVCSGSTLAANRVKGVCDTCPLGCTECSFTTFTTGTNIDQVKCTKCLPGKVLSENKCVDTCPEGTFVGSDGFTCTACSSSCATCSGAANFCLTCKGNQLASGGTCTTSCPTNTFSADGKCRPCHPDCASCTGPGFNQCSSCPPSLPVLSSSKRCLPTCSKTEYFDSGSGSCKSCDASCGSCSAGGSNGCLSCSNPKQVLRAGQCVNVDCGSGTGPAAGLGVCLAELVAAPNNGGAAIPPLDPNAQENAANGGGKKLDWWAILLIVLLCVLAIIIIVLVWRWRARKKRAMQTENFKQNLKKRGLWSRLWRNPFAAWLARRRSRAVTAHDLERRGGGKGDVTPSTTATPWSPGYTLSSSSDRRTAHDVPKSISRGSWVTTSQHPIRRPSFDDRSAVTGSGYGYANNHAGLGARRTIPEERLIDDGDSYRTREYESRRQGSGGSHSDHYGHGDSRYYAQEIDQDERSERTYNIFRTPSQSSYGGIGAVASTKKSFSEGDRYDDSRYHYSQSRSRNYRDRDYDRHGNPVPSHRSHRTRRRDIPDDVSRADSPSIYSSVTGNRRYLPETRENARENLTSRFSVSTVAPSVHHSSKKLSRKQPPPVPELVHKEAPRQLTDAEMYKMSKLFPELLSLASPAKPTNNSTPTIVVQDRNPFRQNSY